MNQFVETNYQVISAVGVQGNYRMYVAEHRQERTRWAIKELPKVPGDTESLERAMEIKDMGDPLLPQIREIYDDDTVLTTVEEYIPGVSLGAYVKDSGAVEEEDVLNWMSQLAGFFYRLHHRERRTVLGDLDPGDLRLMPDNTVRIEDYSTMCGLGSLDNAPYYGFRAPEMRVGGSIGPWTDLYSLGAVAYYAMTGKDPDEVPLRYYPLRHYNSSASAGMEYILNKCLQQNPKARYQSAEELLYDIQNISRFNRVLGRYKGRLFLRGLAVVLLIVAGGALAVFGSMTMQGEQRGSYTALIESAELSAAKGDYDAAFLRLQEAQDILGEDVASYEKWSDYLYRQGAYTACAEYCSRQLSVFPDSKTLVLNLAMSDYQLGEYRVAAEFFRTAGESRMDQERMFAYVLCLLRLDRVEEAADVFYSHTEIWDYAHSYYLQGEISFARGELQEAADALGGAVKESGESTLKLDAVKLLTQVYREMYTRDRDAEALGRAVQVMEAALQDPALAGDTQLKLSYAEISLLHDSSGAADLAEMVRGLVDDGEHGVDAYCVLIRAYGLSGQKELMLETAQEAVELHPDSWQLHARLALAEIQQKRADDEQPPIDSIYAEYIMAEGLIGEEEPDEAMTELRIKIAGYREMGLIRD